MTLSLISQSALLPPCTPLGPLTWWEWLPTQEKERSFLLWRSSWDCTGKSLRLSAIGEDLKFWVLIFNSSQMEVIHRNLDLASHGSDRHLARRWQPPFTEVEWDPQGVAQSNITQNYMVYGSVPSNTITWVEPLLSSFIKSLAIQDIQEQILLTTSTENRLYQSHHAKLASEAHQGEGHPGRHEQHHCGHLQQLSLGKIPLQTQLTRPYRELLWCHQENSCTTWNGSTASLRLQPKWTSICI